MGLGAAVIWIGSGRALFEGFLGKVRARPFQFAGVSELALIGLTAMGVTLALMAVAALVGAGFEAGANRTGKRRVIGVLIGTGFIAGCIYVLWISKAWPLVIGATASIVFVVIIMLSPVVPRAIKESSSLPFGAMAIVYVSFASAHLGGERAKSIIVGERERVANVILAGGDDRVMSFVGRLGDTYVFWSKITREVVLIPCEEVKTFSISVKAIAGE